LEAFLFGMGLALQYAVKRVNVVNGR
jgi:hypothetical protein